MSNELLSHEDYVIGKAIFKNVARLMSYYDHDIRVEYKDIILLYGDDYVKTVIRKPNEYTIKLINEKFKFHMDKGLIEIDA